jgi:DNA-binding transcriptional MerR regulator
MRTKELADWLGLATATIRLWAKDEEFGRYLSPGGAGGDGRRRAFNDIDARVMAHIARLKAQGFDRDELYVALDQLKNGDWEEVPPMPPAPPGMKPILMVPQSTAETAVTSQRQALLKEIVFLQERIEELKSELVEEKERGIADRERLLREIGDVRSKLADSEAELRLWRSGRLKPE